MTLLDYINHRLDRAANVSFGSVSPFHAFSATALVFATVVALGLTVRLGLSPLVILVLIVVNLSAACALAVAVKVITGSERHTHYHYEIVVLAASTLILWALGQPVLRYLDLIVVGKGLLLAIGRLGCFAVGCCHGRPSRVGVCYRHGKAGFTRHYGGVRLFPAQLLESLIVWLLTGICVFLLVRGALPGTSLSTYVVGYSSARFFIEFLRGDPQRPYLWNFSEAQWTALLLLSLVASFEYASVLPFHISHVIAGATVCSAAIAVSLRRRQTEHKLYAPRHVAEVAKAFELVSRAAPEKILTARTSQGVQVFASRLQTTTALIDHYSLSRRDGEMTEETARFLLRLVPRLAPEEVHSTNVVEGNGKVFHLLIYRTAGRSV